jgi:hypothetical protein
MFFDRPARLYKWREQGVTDRRMFEASDGYFSESSQHRGSGPVGAVE